MSMDLDDFFTSTFLKATDLKGKPTVVTIAEASKGKTPDGKPQIVLGFKDTDKVFGINKVNGETIAGLIGTRDASEWIGHSVKLYPSRTEVNGQMKNCIRVDEQFHEAPARDARASDDRRDRRDGGDRMPF